MLLAGGTKMQKLFQLTILVWCAALVVAACTPAQVQDPGLTKESGQDGVQAEVQGAEGSPEQARRRKGVTATVSPSEELLLGLPPYPHGDRIDWVQALRGGKITPHANLSGTGEQSVMDMDVVIAVEGSVADVLFSHKAHTEWLACGNCHVQLFQMQSGANPVGMIKITQKESCGVCHGSVAFPMADCQRCHSQPK